MRKERRQRMDGSTGTQSRIENFIHIRCHRLSAMQSTTQSFLSRSLSLSFLVSGLLFSIACSLDHYSSDHCNTHSHLHARSPALEYYSTSTTSCLCPVRYASSPTPCSQFAMSANSHPSVQTRDHFGACVTACPPALIFHRAEMS